MLSMMPDWRTVSPSHMGENHNYKEGRIAMRPYIIRLNPRLGLKVFLTQSGTPSRLHWCQERIPDTAEINVKN
jgi:hypothetical protein